MKSKCLKELELRKIDKLSGDKCQIYSVWEDGDDMSLFEHFVSENMEHHSEEIIDIYNRLKLIGNELGAREQFFKHNEGKPGDLVCALYDLPSKKLRLYCVRYGSLVVVLGGGGEKRVKAWQDDTKLKKEAEKIINISNIIAESIRDKEIDFTDGIFEDDIITIETYE